MADHLICLVFQGEENLILRTEIEGPPDKRIQQVKRMIRELKGFSDDEGIHVSLLCYGGYKNFLDLECLGGSIPDVLRPEYCKWDAAVEGVSVSGGEESQREETEPTHVRLTVSGKASKVAQLLEKLLRFAKQEMVTSEEGD